MRHKWMLAAALAVTLVAFAQKNDSPEVMLGAGLHQEEIDGNCKEAIKTYQKVIQLKNVPRNVAARAQFHIGTCQEKLGQREARIAYEAVLNRYADQAETAVQARARIAALGGPGNDRRQSTAMANRQVGALDPNFRSLGMSEDGRYIAYTETVGRDLFLRDFITGENRKLPRNTDGQGHSDGATFSRDGRQLAFSWHYDSDSHFALWVIDLQQPATTPPRQLLSLSLDGQAGGALNWMSPTDWSPDGTQIAVYIQVENGPGRETQRIDLVNAKDGSSRILRSEEAIGQVSNVLFSPDGKFLAYGIPGAKPAIQRDIAVTPLLGGAEIPVIVDPAQDVLVGWSPDGNHLLFTSDRSGMKSLYAIALVNGKRQGEPILIKEDFSSGPLRLNSSGELYYESRDARRIHGDIKTASFDFATERFIEPPSIGVKDFIGHNAAADWSRDGKYLLNISDRDRLILVIHSAETGEFVRELRPPLTLNQGVPWPKWAPDSKSIAVPATDVNGRQGIFRVDAQTSEASPLVLSEHNENVRGPAFSPDGKKFFYTRILAPAQPGQQRVRVLIERDLPSGSEKELMRGIDLTVILVSPDGKYFTTVRNEADGAVAVLVPTIGGQPTELMRVKSPERLWVETWAPDSRSVFIGKLPEPFDTYWRVSLDGSDRHTVRLDQNMGLGVSLHPDGRRIAYAVGSQQNKTEVWVLENFLSALKQPR